MIFVVEINANGLKLLEKVPREFEKGHEAQYLLFTDQLACVGVRRTSFYVFLRHVQFCLRYFYVVLRFSRHFLRCCAVATPFL